MKPNFALAILALGMSLSAHAKTFQNSYVAFEVPDDWGCLQEGVAWTCNPLEQSAAKEAVIVLAAKVAGPEDSLPSFLSFLRQPKKIMTKIGTPMPSEVMYAQTRDLGGQKWVQSQHLGSEIQDYYTLYLATVKDHLAILVSFSAEKNHYKTYNPIFDKAIKTLKIVASNQLLFQRKATGGPELIGITVPGANPSLLGDELIPEPQGMNAKKLMIVGLPLLLLLGMGGYLLATRKDKKSRRKSTSNKPKSNP